MKTTIKKLKQAKTDVINTQLELINQGISFFSLTVQGLQDTEEKLTEAIKSLEGLQHSLKAMKK